MDRHLSEANSLSSWDDDLHTHHDRFFSTVLADTEGLLEAAHALRFQVYCLERGFENAAEHPNGLEKDAYDSHSIHGVLFHRPTRRPIGTVRAILPKASNSLPVWKALRAHSVNLLDYVNLSHTIEISRFAISKDFRRRRSDQERATSSRQPTDCDKGASLPFLSLIQFILRESIKHDVHYWTALMEPTLLRLLARMGICYTPIGPLVEHHGIRQPCYCYVPEMLENLRRKQPGCWNVLTDAGALHDQLATKLSKLAVA